MSEEKRKKNLMRFVQAGRRTGLDLRQRRNPVEMGGSTAPSEIERVLGEAEAKVDGTLWERDWASTALRSVERSLDGAALEALHPRIDRIAKRLDEADEREIGPLRGALAAGTFGAKDFLAALDDCPPYQWDAFTRRLLLVHHVPVRETERPPMMVHYLPSPLDAILAIAEILSPEDVFYDIGSGLGLVTMLVAWISGARAKGVEYEPAYHRRAVELAEQLRMPRVEYIQSDARAVDYADGTVFYVYDTFRGPILEEMIEVLSHQRARGIRVVSRGKSTPVFEQVSWLRKRGELESQLTLFTA